MPSNDPQSLPNLPKDRRDRLMPCRRLVLPLINKRWARLLPGPSAVWRDMLLDAIQDFSEGRMWFSAKCDGVVQRDSSLEVAATINWFRARPDAVEKLALVAWSDSNWLPGALLAGILGTQISSLRQLAVRSAVQFGLGSAELSVLASCKNLRVLHLVVRGTRPDWTDHSRALIKVVALLPVFERLELSPCYSNSSSTSALPACAELAELASCSLQYISLSMAASDGAQRLLLGHLPALTSCQLKGEKQSAQ